jgi:hypothetical protein
MRGPFLIAVLAAACNRPGAQPTPPPPLSDENLACASDADCEAAGMPNFIDGACCFACPQFPAQRGWKERVIQECTPSASPPPCPRETCERVPPVACVSGRCAFR